MRTLTRLTIQVQQKVVRIYTHWSCIRISQAEHVHRPRSSMVGLLAIWLVPCFCRSWRCQAFFCFLRVITHVSLPFALLVDLGLLRIIGVLMSSLQNAPVDVPTR